ncbi:MAG: hypothetical protein E6R05_04825 [Candidatus Moraniibacteriota bacterium]|nr:MAG: hypothetical protein E6R05_04825 [Candidatus Moranbacteria bacterium]
MPQKKETIIVKLGGSIVTLKHASTPAIRRAHMRALGQALRKQYNPKQHSLILIHGAGSFGHLHAHRYALALGTKDHLEKTFRAVENQSLDAKLNSELTNLFIQSGLPVVGMPTRAIAFNRSGMFSSLFVQSIETALQAGAIPLLHGDMVFDRAWGLSILSGDVLLAKLAKQFKVSKIFFASDVDGVFSEDPHRFQNATLVQTTTLEKLNQTAKLTSSHNQDVTGGLAKKFTYLQGIRSLRSIYFFNGLIPKNFSFLFDQKDFFGTVIHKK